MGEHLLKPEALGAIYRHPRLFNEFLAACSERGKQCKRLPQLYGNALLRAVYAACGVQYTDVAWDAATADGKTVVDTRIPVDEILHAITPLCISTSEEITADCFSSPKFRGLWSVPAVHPRFYPTPERERSGIALADDLVQRAHRNDAVLHHGAAPLSSIAAQESAFDAARVGERTDIFLAIALAVAHPNFFVLGKTYVFSCRIDLENRDRLPCIERATEGGLSLTCVNALGTYGEDFYSVRIDL